MRYLSCMMLMGALSGCVSDTSTSGSGSDEAPTALAVAPEAPAAAPGAGRAPTMSRALKEAASAPAVRGAQPASMATTPPSANDLLQFTQDIPGKGRLVATLHTTMGELKCELFEDVAPMTVANFVGLARGLKAWINPHDGQPMVGVPLYKDIALHRVIPDFIIQGGDPLSAHGQRSSELGKGKPGYIFKDENIQALRFDRPGRLSMANAGPDTNGSQFFITEVALPHLDHKSTIFGQCEDSPIIAALARVPSGPKNKPKVRVNIVKISFLREP